MDSEKLIEQLRKSADFEDYPIVASFAAIIEKKYLRDAATALSALQAENEKLRREVADLETTHRTEMCENGYDCVELGKVRTKLEEVKRTLAEMWFAYENKDGAVPHDFEERAVEMAQEILGPWGECMPKYLRRGPHKED